MAPAATEQSQQEKGKWGLFKPGTWGKGKKAKVGHLPEGESNMYYNAELKRWVEKGKEHEVANDPGNAPPPTMASGLPTAPVQRKAINQRYVLQSNLSVSSSASSLPDVASSAQQTGVTPSPPTSASGLAPPRFFVPAAPTATAPANESEDGQAEAADTKGMSGSKSAPTFFMPPGAGSAKSSKPSFFVPSPIHSTETSPTGPSDAWKADHAMAETDAPSHEPSTNTAPHSAPETSAWGNFQSPEVPNSECQSQTTVAQQDQHPNMAADATWGHFQAAQPTAATSDMVGEGAIAAEAAHSQAAAEPVAPAVASDPSTTYYATVDGGVTTEASAYYNYHNYGYYQQGGDAAYAEHTAWGAHESAHAGGAAYAAGDANMWGSYYTDANAAAAAVAAPHAEVQQPVSHAPDALATQAAAEAHHQGAPAAPESGPRSGNMLPIPTNLNFKGLQSKGKELLGALAGLVQQGAAGAEDDELDFDGVMHPGSTRKLDGPLPWELPDHLKHSDQFITICSNWQKNNPGLEYRPELLLPEAEEVQQQQQEAPADVSMAEAQAAPAADDTPTKSAPAAVSAAPVEPAGEYSHAAGGYSHAAFQVPDMDAPVAPANGFAAEAVSRSAATDVPEAEAPVAEPLLGLPPVAVHKAAESSGRMDSADALQLSGAFASPFPATADSGPFSYSVTADSHTQGIAADISFLHDLRAEHATEQCPPMDAAPEVAPTANADLSGITSAFASYTQDPFSQPPAQETVASSFDSAPADEAAFFASLAPSDAQQVLPPMDLSFGGGVEQVQQPQVQSGESEDALPPIAAAMPRWMTHHAGDGASFFERLGGEEPDRETMISALENFARYSSGLDAAAPQAQEAAQEAVHAVADEHHEATHHGPAVEPLPPSPQAHAHEEQQQEEEAPVVEQVAVEPAAPADAGAAPAQNFVPLRDNLAVNQLHGTAAFVQQLLQDLREGREVHPATLQEAVHLMRLFQDPTLTSLSAGSQMHTPVKKPSGELEGMFAFQTPVRHATYTHTMQNPSPITDPSASTPSELHDSASGTPSADAQPAHNPHIHMTPTASYAAQHLRDSVEYASPVPTAHGTGGVAASPQWPYSPLPAFSGQPADMTKDYSAALSALRRELQEEFEHKLTLRTMELEARFEEKLSDMRRELESEYERRLAEKAEELEEARAKCDETQNELDELLLCLGQETGKVAALSDAMRAAGLDPDAITGPIEEEYAMMDLPGVSGAEEAEVC
mmetsp:Transcript_26574/g.57967  ORF Transcript_26574/g.57967 Transcript_26574/m.57967 type:complete len:1239 (-) Transcript_26574:809-4525(-)|eukprot:CAMPEP_0202905302 /NCGR_PEP_ID=MMETSP1392-20130828/33501_1 /ASSEMBLY_ACC=CAM_ASM_000868 /TAXON_ID=225041 /ORGANISM="Chlamydomonas chlamydogama, Strain SAG 11-48b" /LENGTH=1238 /DNA_ID=CAMNT_0049593333 /DNA_START=64 /DNA_END=3780 /DNA_ORIENTATION=+